MPYLTVCKARATKQRTYRYFVELASSKLDCQGVPETSRIVDVVVLEPTKEAIQQLITAAGWLQDYKIISHWIPDDCSEF